MITGMKKSVLYTALLLIVFSLMGVSCRKDGYIDSLAPNPPVVNPDVPNSPSYPTFDSPHWSVSNISAFEHTMIVSAVLPDSIVSGEQPADELAVFVGDDCRGVADRIEVSVGRNIWMAMVYGNNISEVLSFKYYSSKTKYMYQSTSTTPFKGDGTIGTIDSPQTIGMRIVTGK